MAHATERMRGVFSSQEISKVGTGTTTRKTVAKTFWYAEEEKDGRISILPINSNYVPTGKKRFVTRDELIDKFSPEPEFYIQTVFPKMRELNDTLDRADSARTKGEVFSAEFEYDNALQVDIENVRANFGIGLTYLARGETDKADNIFVRLVNLDGAYAEEHKHLFNDFGISLRKNKMLDQSLEYYSKAVHLAVQDENLFINIARVYLDKHDIPKVIEYLAKALELTPKNEVALKFLAWMENKKLITSEQLKAVKPKKQQEAAGETDPDQTATGAAGETSSTPTSESAPDQTDSSFP